jgi:hypothetical protein
MHVFFECVEAKTLKSEYFGDCSLIVGFDAELFLRDGEYFDEKGFSV